MTIWPNWRYLFAALTLTGSTGCISWYSGTAVPVPPSPIPAGRERSKIALDVSYHVGADLKASEEARQRAIDQVSTLGREVFERTGHHRVTARGQTDYVLKLDVVDEGEPHIGLAVLSGITLTLVPAYAEDKYTIDVELSSRDGKRLASRSIHENMTTFIELFMIFGMPFSGPKDVSKKMWYDVFSDLAAWSDTTIGSQPEGPRQAVPVAALHRVP